MNQEQIAEKFRKIYPKEGYLGMAKYVINLIIKEKQDLRASISNKTDKLNLT